VVESWLNEKATIEMSGTLLASYMLISQGALAGGQAILPLFALGGAFDPPDAPNVTTPQESPKSPSSSDDTEAARMERERLARIEAMRTEAGRLRLRSVIVGQRPAAVIEVTGAGRPRSVVLRKGQALEGFVLTEIRPNSVLLMKDEFPFELTLEFPQQQQ